MRIKVSLAAYTYEFFSESILSDAEFDKLCLEVDPSISTVEDWYNKEQIKRTKRLDQFFKDEFSPYTGQWVHKHPELDRLHFLYQNRYGSKCT